MSFFVYILTCKDSNGKITYYTGYTNNLDRRVAEHQNGTGARYTRGKEVYLSYAYEYPNRSVAMSMEKLVKKMSHNNKAYLSTNWLNAKARY